MKLRIWLWKDLYKDETACEWVRLNCDGIFLGCNEAKPFYNANKETLPNTMLIVDEWFHNWELEYPEIIKFYCDEPLTMGTNAIKYYDKHFSLLTIGEITPSNFKQLDNRVNEFMFTSYQTYWFTIFGINIYKWWINQIESVKWLMKTYPNRVKKLWVNIRQTKDFPELIKFAKEYSLEIWIYAGQSDTTTKELIINGNNLIAELNK